MRTINVNLKERSYPIVIGRGLLGSLGRRCRVAGLGTDAFCVSNPRVYKLYGRALESSLRAAGFGVARALVADSEKSKSFASCSRLLSQMARADRRKRLFVVALGGGVVGDTAGFCAAVYKRGIPYVQVPTTLLAQVDSAIGGKTAIDLAQGKNLVGAFYQPRLVLSDVAALGSLPARQICAGMAEAVKYGIIRDPGLFSLLEKEGIGAGGDSALLERIVVACSSVKARIVEKDERDDKGVRIILNFGHTVGHAIEAACGYGRYSHGEAVSIGMACACDISTGMGLLDNAVARRIEICLRELRLPVSFKGIAPGKIIEPLLRDKKFRGSNRFVLLEKIGSPIVVDNVPLDLVRDALRKRAE